MCVEGVTEVEYVGKEGSRVRCSAGLGLMLMLI